MAARAAEDIKQLSDKIQIESLFLKDLEGEVRKRLVGQENMFRQLMIGLLAKGHILLEGVPGLAKTLAINALADSIQAEFSRIQFTPDLLPADVIGTLIFNQATSEFVIKKGPIFANFILADEINRAPAKVQSALLEAMQERQVTIGDETHKLKEPFLVLATQNPIEQEGTYPLPEAQVDRFMLKVKVDYPNKEEERIIIRRNTGQGVEAIKGVVKPKQILDARKTLEEIYVDEKIEQYILDLVAASRNPTASNLDELKNLISVGASPRGSINLALAGKASAYLSGRGFVIPEDIRGVAHDVLRHRIGLSYEAEAENISSDEIIDQLIKKVEVP